MKKLTKISVRGLHMGYIFRADYGRERLVISSLPNSEGEGTVGYGAACRLLSPRTEWTAYVVHSPHKIIGYTQTVLMISYACPVPHSLITNFSINNIRFFI